jgi:hypothetical protein
MRKDKFNDNATRYALNRISVGEPIKESHIKDIEGITRLIKAAGAAQIKSIIGPLASFIASVKSTETQQLIVDIEKKLPGVLSDQHELKNRFEHIDRVTFLVELFNADRTRLMSETADLLKKRL